jgi:hypothetical protein
MLLLRLFIGSLVLKWQAKSGEAQLSVVSHSLDTKDLVSFYDFFISR